jgi:hypothetical protein
MATLRSDWRSDGRLGAPANDIGWMAIGPLMSAVVEMARHRMATRHRVAARRCKVRERCPFTLDLFDQERRR